MTLNRRNFLSSLSVLPLAATMAPTGEALGAVLGKSHKKGALTVTYHDKHYDAGDYLLPLREFVIQCDDVDQLGGPIFENKRGRRVIFPSFEVRDGGIVGEYYQGPTRTNEACIKDRLDAVYASVVQVGFDDFPGGDPDNWYLATFHFISGKGECWSLAAMREEFALERLRLILPVTLAADITAV
jgi:hypothetical protein